MNDREEVRERVKKLLDDPTYQQPGKIIIHDIPDTSNDDKPPKDWKQDAGGKWFAPGWRKKGDTFVTNNEPDDDDEEE